MRWLTCGTNWADEARGLDDSSVEDSVEEQGRERCGGGEEVEGLVGRGGEEGSEGQEDAGGVMGEEERKPRGGVGTR